MSDTPRTGSPREQRLARHGQGRAQAAAADRGVRKAARQAQFWAAAQRLTERLTDARWSDVTIMQAGAELVIAGLDPQGNAHAAHGEDAQACIATLIGVGERTRRAAEEQAAEVVPAAEQPPLTSRTITIDEATYTIAPADALKLTGAFVIAMNRGETLVQLASGDALLVTSANAEAIAAQLAGGH